MPALVCHTMETILVYHSSVYRHSVVVLKIPKLKPYTMVCTYTPRRSYVVQHLSILSPSDPSPGDLKLIVRPADTVVAAGSTLELYCIAEGPEATSVQWLKDGSPVGDRVSVMGSGQVLEITGATTGDGGSYTCVVMAGNGSVNSSAVVIVVGEFNV